MVYIFPRLCVEQEIEAALKLIYIGKAVVDVADMPGFIKTCRTLGLFGFDVGVIISGLGEQSTNEGNRKRKRDDETTSEESTSDCSLTSSSDGKGLTFVF